MPPKGKTTASKSKGSDASKPKAAATSSSTAPASNTPTQPGSLPFRTIPGTPAPATQPKPPTVSECSWQRYDETRPYEAAQLQLGLSALSKPEQDGWISARLVREDHRRERVRLSQKAQRELWRHANELSLPVRALKRRYIDQEAKGAAWGLDRNRLDLGEYPVNRFEERRKKRVLLTSLEVASWGFRTRRKQEPGFVVTETECQEEKQRRKYIATLRRELYGEMSGASLSQDPEWDDVVPIPHEEPEKALAAIAYPAEYAEAISYLRAVMLKKEYSGRCLRLTEHIISMNAAHYTVWLYRASIVQALKMSIPDEIEWLNKIALENLKNYQIWHHRHLLADMYYPQIADSPEKVKAFADSERAFLADILRQDTKNYHVWSYRSYLVGKLQSWGAPEELKDIERMIDEDVRNNSAWSHRFYLVFSNPAQSTPGTAATEADPAVPADIIDREVTYAQNQTYLAPQNQSAWNYLKGALVKGGRKLSSVEDFVKDFVKNLGEEDEIVKSTHALDLLAEIYAEKGEKEQADLCLRRLAEKWDPIRVGYWEWRRKGLTQ